MHRASAVLLAWLVACGEGGPSTVAEAGDVADAEAVAADVADDEATAGDVADDEATGVDVAGQCVDDSREEDDSLAVALAGDPVYDLGGRVRLTGLVACPGDDDFVGAWADCCGDPLGAEISWDPADGDLAMEVLAPDGSPWPTDDDVSEPGRWRRVATAPATADSFVVHVWNLGSTPVPYDAFVYARVYGP